MNHGMEYFQTSGLIFHYKGKIAQAFGIFFHMQVEGSQGHGSFSHPFLLKKFHAIVYSVVIGFLLLHRCEPHTTPLMRLCLF